MRFGEPIEVPEEGAVLDRRLLNRSLLARQLLLERVDGEPVEVIERLVGMQGQVPLDPYTGLWSRLRAFDPAAVGAALVERRLVRMTLMRTTLHLVSARDALRLRPLLQGMIERAFASSPFARELNGLDLEPVLRLAVELLEERPLTVAQLGDALGERWPDRDANSLAYAARYLLPLVQVPPRGVWGKTLRPTVTTLESWLGPAGEAEQSLEELVGRYLRAFGPASSADLRAWSWLGDVRPLIQRLRPRLRIYRDEAGRELFDVPDGVFCDGSTRAPARFLPQYDNLFLAHADRARVMKQVQWGPAFTHRGALFVDGFLAGAWRHSEKRREASLAVELQLRVAAAELRGVKREAERLLEFLSPDAPTRRVELASA
jgi:hypothetical protein